MVINIYRSFCSQKIVLEFLSRNSLDLVSFIVSKIRYLSAPINVD